MQDLAWLDGQTRSVVPHVFGQNLQRSAFRFVRVQGRWGEGWLYLGFVFFRLTGRLGIGGSDTEQEATQAEGENGNLKGLNARPWTFALHGSPIVPACWNGRRGYRLTRFDPSANTSAS